MPPAPVPAAVDEFLRRPNPAVVASLRRDGSPHTVATWYDWDDNRVLLNMDESRLRLRFMRRDPRVSLTVLDETGWHRHVSLLGRIVSLEEDRDLRDIDRLALRYTGEEFRTRDRRRFSAWIGVEAWHGWDGSHPWPSEAGSSPQEPA
jgi:PPOX class probable F420-dependent enzyme